jgi:CheY-like chemotaxis protein
MLRRVVESGIRLEADCQEQLPAVYGDQGMLEQVLMNLVLNARDAMPAGGELRITTNKITIGQCQPLSHPEARPGEFVCLGVQDTGSGIAPENLLRIFEPFFTTKPIGAGTGLGLSTVYGITKQHRGWVQVASELGKGTRFEVLLPVHNEAQGNALSEERAAELTRGTERILIAEGDEAVRRLTARVLEGLGYSVTEAPSGKAAFGLWDSAGGKFDLLLTDLLMIDGVTGKDLADKLRHLNPNLKVIFTSGYGHGNSNMDAGFFRRSNFLQKPYSSTALAKAVRRCLDEQESA